MKPVDYDHPFRRAPCIRRPHDTDPDRLLCTPWHRGKSQYRHEPDYRFYPLKYRSRAEWKLRVASFLLDICIRSEGSSRISAEPFLRVLVQGYYLIESR